MVPDAELDIIIEEVESSLDRFELLLNSVNNSFYVNPKK
jgi:hypothetical protein